MRLSSVGSGDRLIHAGDLLTSTHDASAVTIGDDGLVLLLALSTLPDLNFHTTTDDTNTHCGEKVVCGVARRYVSVLIVSVRHEIKLTCDDIRLR